MAVHFEGADERAASIAELMDPVGFDVYGAAPPATVDQLRRDAAASGAELRAFPGSLGGFLRAAIGHA